MNNLYKTYSTQEHSQFMLIRFILVILIIIIFGISFIIFENILISSGASFGIISLLFLILYPRYSYILDKYSEFERYNYLGLVIISSV